MPDVTHAETENPRGRHESTHSTAATRRGERDVSAPGSARLRSQLCTMANVKVFYELLLSSCGRSCGEAGAQEKDPHFSPAGGTERASGLVVRELSRLVLGNSRKRACGRPAGSANGTRDLLGSGGKGVCYPVPLPDYPCFQT